MKKLLSILALALSLASFAQTRLDSVYIEAVNSGDPERYYFKYLPNINMWAEFEISGYDELLGVHYTREAGISTFNNLDLRDNTISQHRNNPQDPLVNHSREEILYNSNGKLAQSISSNWGVNSLSWELDFKYTHLYNNDNQVTQHTWFGYDTLSANWKLGGGFEYTYTNGKLTQELALTPSTNGNKKTYYYNQDGTLSSVQDSIPNNGGGYLYTSKNEYTYGAIKDSVYQVTLYGQNSMLSGTTRYDYDGSGNTILRVEKKFHSVTGGWQYKDSIVMTYDNNFPYNGYVTSLVNEYPKAALTSETKHYCNVIDSTYRIETIKTFYYSDGYGNSTTGIETTINTTDRKLVRIVDILGREVTPTPNTVLIYIYGDGSTEKILQIK